MEDLKKTKENLFSDGANWVRVDFHLHSPLVHSFKLPSGINLSSEQDIKKIIDEYVSKLKEQEIEICAITDYQQIRKEWWAPFQEASAKQNIFVFPGIELSVSDGNGLHILLIFEYDSNIDTINRYIQSLHRNPTELLIDNERRHKDIQLENKTIRDVLINIKKNFSALIIFAHPEISNGLYKEFQPKEVVEHLKYADAIEYIKDESKAKLISAGLNKKYFEKLAILENSDPKSLDEIGNKLRNEEKKRCTYLKLSSASIHAFKIALQDPQLRVSLYKKPDYKYDKLVSVSIKGNSFLKDVKFEFNQELNSLIGGRGVGKSALIESIRYCLDLPTYSEKSFREEFIQNVVGSGGEISLVFKKFFGDKVQTYSVKRIIGNQPVVKDIDLKPVELFGGKHPILIGQKELYGLSNDKAFQLDLIDELIGDEIKKETQNFKKLLLKLDENAAKLLTLDNQILKKEEYDQELKTVSEQIKTFDKLGVAKKMELNTALNHDEAVLKGTISKLYSNNKEIEDKLIEYIELLENSKEYLLIKGKSVEKDILDKTSKIVENLEEVLKKKKEELSDMFSIHVKQFTEILKDWDDKKNKYNKEISGIKEQLAKQGLSPDKYENLNKEKNRLEPIIQELSKISNDIKKLYEERKQIKNDLKEARRRIFNVRKQKIEEINKKLNDRVILKVSYETYKNNFKEDLKNLLYGSRISDNTINNIINKEINKESLSIDGIDGILLSETILSGKDHLQKTFSLTDAMADKLIEWFDNKKNLFKLEKLFPEDKIAIDLKIADNNYIGENIYKDFDKLSAGQKATALLILMFAQEDRILIIDQPEEDLDNRFIFDDVVSILRKLKGKRQIILATHNANIPVLGDSEQIFVLEADNEKGCILSDVGSIDNQSITENIKNIMEGGEEAFKMRIEKYGVKI